MAKILHNAAKKFDWDVALSFKSYYTRVHYNNNKKNRSIQCKFLNLPAVHFSLKRKYSNYITDKRMNLIK